MRSNPDGMIRFARSATSPATVAASVCHQCEQEHLVSMSDRDQSDALSSEETHLTGAIYLVGAIWEDGRQPDKTANLQFATHPHRNNKYGSPVQIL